MPLYEYECAACAHRFERIQKFSDPLVDVCPECGGAVRKLLLSSPAIQFKGSGFYITDYAPPGEGGGGTDTSESSNPTAATGEKKEAKKEDKKSESADKASSSSESKSDSKEARQRNLGH